MSLTAKSIPSLLVLCKKGNAAAQLEVYNRYQRAMYNTALRIVKDTAEAEDVMQESFITAFNKLETLQKPSTFGAWLKRIVVNNSITSYYKNKRFVAWDETNYMHVVDGAPGVDSGEKCDNPQVLRLLRCMEQLHPNYRTVLNLYYIEGYDYEELGSILNITYGNCRTLLSRAKESLRSKMETQ